MEEKKTKTLGEVLIDKTLEASPAFQEVVTAITLALNTETVLAERVRMCDADLSQVVQAVLALTKLVNAQQEELMKQKAFNAQLQAALSTPRESPQMPSLFGPKKEGRKAN